MSEDDHFSSDMNGPKSSLESFPQRATHTVCDMVWGPHNGFKGLFDV